MDTWVRVAVPLKVRGASWGRSEKNNASRRRWFLNTSALALRSCCRMPASRKFFSRRDAVWRWASPASFVHTGTFWAHFPRSQNLHVQICPENVHIAPDMYTSCTYLCTSAGSSNPTPNPRKRPSKCRRPNARESPRGNAVVGGGGRRKASCYFSESITSLKVATGRMTSEVLASLG
ncbi:hypothetical protein CPPEL_08915 [Corynebacterium pseudopelargi]|uniref:Uncharacterized protein n=1 Tax=Corynebacterium pseudopelargi TaxID=2080757 RepID=A0A3G6IW47_9CORY|nr:hypothetical protein CPPEL_08915 [Corynebacterium pseudopelargi]